jgi:quinol---cytochrome c reductase cytochrome c subunit, bacillus type
VAEVPEHLLKRSRERRKALGLPVEGDDDAAESASADDAPAAVAEEAAPDVEASAPEPETVAAAADGGDAITESKGGVPAHLLERSRRRKEALAGGGGGEAAPAAAAAGATRAATAVATPVPTGTGPGGHTQRLLTVVKSGSIQQTRAEAQDKVHVWPHLLAIEFASLLSLTAFVTVFSALVKAPLLGLADVNATPNPSKAPWYFLGLQELLKMFNPAVAGVLIPGIALGLLAITPYIDRNPSHKPNDRKFAITMMSMFLMMWAVLVIIGCFFRGPGFNFVFPWDKQGIFFEL